MLEATQRQRACLSTRLEGVRRRGLVGWGALPWAPSAHADRRWPHPLCGAMCIRHGPVSLIVDVDYDFYPSRCDSLDDIDLKCLDSSSVGVSCNKTSKSNITSVHAFNEHPITGGHAFTPFHTWTCGRPTGFDSFGTAPNRALRKRGGCGEVGLSPGLIHFRGSESMRSAAPTATPMAVAASRGRLGHAVVGV